MPRENPLPEVMPFTDAPTLAAHGIAHPKTRHQLDHLYNTRSENGLADAFALVGGRRCFKPKVFLELIGAAAQPTKPSTPTKPRKPNKSKA